MSEEIINDTIFAKDNDNFIVRIPKKDIYFIETIKSTHYCHIYYNKGIAKVKGDIKKLSEIMGEEFFKVRSSTVANLNYITMIDINNRILFFGKGRNLQCSYAAKNYMVLKSRLKISNYRSYRKNGNAESY